MRSGSGGSKLHPMSRLHHSKEKIQRPKLTKKDLKALKKQTKAFDRAYAALPSGHPSAPWDHRDCKARLKYMQESPQYQEASRRDRTMMHRLCLEGGDFRDAAWMVPPARERKRTRPTPRLMP